MSKPQKGTGRDVVAEGVYAMVARTIGDIGTQTAKKFGAKSDDDVEEKKQLIIVFELLDHEDSTKENPVTLSGWFTNSLGAKSTLRKLYNAAGLNPGDPKDPDDEPDDLDDLNGKVVLITVSHSEKGREKLSGFAPIKKGAKYPKGFLSFQSVYLDDTYDAEAFEALPKFIQDQALKSPEFTEVDEASKNARKKNTGKKK